MKTNYVQAWFPWWGIYPPIPDYTISGTGTTTSTTYWVNYNAEQSAKKTRHKKSKAKSTKTRKRSVAKPKRTTRKVGNKKR